MNTKQQISVAILVISLMIFFGAAAAFEVAFAVFLFKLLLMLVGFVGAVVGTIVTLITFKVIDV